ncbi:hypothetical protein G6F56_002306 [Rhizopus delemar]|nr:hypothetical protein G6F56_002306 [Rhizopus delemar]
MSNVVETIEFLRSLFFDDEFEWASKEDQENYEAIEQEENPQIQYLAVRLKAPVKEQQLYFLCRISLMDSDYQLSLPWTDNGWLSRQDHEQLMASMVPGEDRTSGILENIQQLQMLAEPMLVEEKEQVREKTEQCDFLREWIWFPMIYTREKRGHIISWAPSYQITGFLCPGKPGCMCLEGSKEKVAQFIHDIKTISWSDIPSSHKKMTSQWKEAFVCNNSNEFESHRLFKEMTEIKFDIHGAFSNHNDLGKLQLWMEEKGCGEAFEHLFEMS